MESDHRIRHVSAPLDVALEGFIRAYQNAFGGPPYFESYTREEVAEVWAMHLQHGLFVAEDRTGEVVGLACCHPLHPDLHPSVFNFLIAQPALPFPIEGTVYMSEVAVLERARNRGLGQRLIDVRMDLARELGHSHYVMRTANEGSNSVRLYERLGALRAPFIQDVRTDPQEVPSASNQRQYLWGPIR